MTMIRVGVSGHRQLANLEAVINAVDEVLGQITTRFGGDSLQVISPLAEGADRIVAGRALGLYSARLVVPLPLEMEEYMLDFNSFSSKAEFLTLLEQAGETFELPRGETRAASYLAAGIYVLDFSDVLIALWDGEPVEGTGGTAEIVAEARRRAMPMAWVQAARSKSDSSTSTKKVSMDVEIHYERFPDQNIYEAGVL